MPNVAIIPQANPRVPALSAVIDGWPHLKRRLETSTGGAPLEDGAEVTDHAVAREEILTLTGFVSNFRDNSGRRADEAYSTLRRLHRAVTPLIIICPWATYDQMLIHRVDDENLGLGSRFTIQFKEVLRVGLRPNEITNDKASGPAKRRSSQVERGRVIPERQRSGGTFGESEPSSGGTFGESESEPAPFF